MLKRVRLNIRPATARDAGAIREAALTLQWRGRDPEECERTGFLMEVLPEEGYAQRLRWSPLCFVSMRDSRCLGFLLAVDVARVKPTPGAHDPYLEALLAEGEPPILVEQFAVIAEFQGTGLAQALLQVLIRHYAPDRRIAAFITHAPMRNGRAIAFTTRKSSFELRREFRPDWTLRGLYIRPADAPLPVL